MPICKPWVSLKKSYVALKAGASPPYVQYRGFDWSSCWLFVSLFSGSDATNPELVFFMVCACVFVVADAVFDGELVPIPLIADTLYVYVVLDCNPVSEYVVAVLPVFATMTANAPPLDLSILYPVIADPPLFAGALQERLI